MDKVFSFRFSLEFLGAQWKVMLKWFLKEIASRDKDGWESPGTSILVIMNLLVLEGLKLLVCLNGALSSFGDVTFLFQVHINLHNVISSCLFSFSIRFQLV